MASEDTFTIEGLSLHDESDMNPVQANKKEGHCTVMVNNKSLKLKVDTGAKCNVISADTLKVIRHIESLYKPHKQVKLVAFGGAMINPIGAVNLQCMLNEQSYDLQFQVVKENVHSILGLKDSLKMKLVTFSKEVHHIDTAQQQALSERVFEDYADLFKDEVGDLPVTYSMKIDPNVAPVVNPPRRIPVAMQGKVEKELQRMQALGVIEPVEEWVSNMVATRLGISPF